MKTKSLLTSLFLILGLCIYTAVNTSFANGFGGGTGNCQGCHGTDANTVVAVNGLPDPWFGYTANVIYPITVTVTNASQAAAGFDISATGGSFINPGTGVAVNGTTASHVGGATAMVSGTATFNLSWQAPSNGIINFTAKGNAVNLNGLSSGDGANTAPTISISLPVNFTNLRAIPIDDYIRLSFETNEEELIKQFEIERSLDGSEFKTIKVLNPKGDSKYSFDDHTVLKNTPYFYRIKEVSIDGINTFSSVVRSILSTDSKNDILIYPTVISNSQVGVDGLNFSELNIAEVYDMNGKKVLTQKISTSLLELNPLVQGFYILNIQTNNKSVKTQRILIQ